MPVDPTDDPSAETKEITPLDEGDIALLKTYGVGPYSKAIKKLEEEIASKAKRVNELKGIKESDTGLAPPSQWDLALDRQMMQEEQPLQVARCTKIINPNTEDAKYVINIRQMAKYVVGLGERLAPTDIEEGMRVVRIQILPMSHSSGALTYTLRVGCGQGQVPDPDPSAAQDRRVGHDDAGRGEAGRYLR